MASSQDETLQRNPAAAHSPARAPDGVPDGVGRGEAFQGDPTEPVLGLPTERAAAMIPADLLQGDETILMILKPSPLYVLLGSLGALTAIIAAGLAALWLQRYTGMRFIEEQSLLALTLTLAAARLVWQFLEWMSRTYVLTDRRVIRYMGVLRIQMFQAELKRLQHTEVLWTIRERLFGLGTIAFSTAGTGFPEAYWVMLANPIGVHKRIIQAINRYGR